MLDRWYATAVLWRPQLAFFVHEATLLAMVMALAPAVTTRPIVLIEPDAVIRVRHAS